MISAMLIKLLNLLNYKIIIKCSSYFIRVDVTNVWGHMNLFAKGAGQAVAQLDLTYGVDYEPYKVKSDTYVKLRCDDC